MKGARAQQIQGLRLHLFWKSYTFEMKIFSILWNVPKITKTWQRFPMCQNGVSLGIGGLGVGWIFSLKSGLKILIWAPKNSQNDQIRAASGGIKIPRRLFNEITLKPKTLDLENVGWWWEGDVGEFVQFAGGVLERQVIGARCHQINAGDVFTHGYWGLPLAPLKEKRKGKQFGKDHLHGWYVESPLRGNNYDCVCRL